MNARRDFLKKAALLAGGTGLWDALPESIKRAMAIDPAVGSTWHDAEHVVLLMQENRSFDHCYGTLQGVRGFNDPRAIYLPNGNPVWLQSNQQGHTYAPFRLNIKDSKATWMRDLPHSWENQVDARNKGKYDKWLDAKCSGNKDYKDLPLTMGYYNREDIPFYYALADAFTVCDQHFCSSLTGTTSNRMFFWTGKLRDQAGKAYVRNSEVGYDREVNWKTFPERLEEIGISWKVYQNELSLQTGLAGEDEALLSNFTDNNLEWFSQYNVRFSPGHYRYLQQVEQQLAREIDKLKSGSLSLSGPNAKALDKEIERQEAQLREVKENLAKWHPDRFADLGKTAEQLHRKAFTINDGDPHYHETEELAYEKEGEQHQLRVPKGDLFYQFRKDVAEGQLPTVSWLVAPQRFSDHPSSPWYGAWYVSETLDILTSNPEVWKKTIFILTYDENDGYFDHVPPFVAPHPADVNTGAVSRGLDTSAEFVTLEEELKKEGMDPRDARQSPVGLGYRVPMVVASPWSRGGWVNSELCDITSTLLFLEKFLTHKTGKPVKETNISSWRRAICGDITSVFRPYHGEEIALPSFVKREELMPTIHQAQFMGLPDTFRNIALHDQEASSNHASTSDLLPKQEPGIRDANALPYELYVDGDLNEARTAFEISFVAANQFFGASATGAAFSIYAPGKYWHEDHQGNTGFMPVNVWDIAVAAGEEVRYQWPLARFDAASYHLRAYGPNGYFREFAGNGNDLGITVKCGYERVSEGTMPLLSGNVVLMINIGKPDVDISIVDHAYGQDTAYYHLEPGVETEFVVHTQHCFGWYDFSLQVAGQEAFIRRYAGRVETGKASKSDPLMGRIIV